MIDERAIAARNDEMARQIVAELGPEFVMVIVLKGAFVFGADLLRSLARAGARPRVEFLGLSSYGAARETSGAIIPWTPIPAVKDQRVLVIEDVLDSGLTVTHAIAALRQAGAAEVRLCALLDKPMNRRTPVSADYVGFTIPNRFVVGYGIDWAERWREIGHIAAVD